MADMMILTEKISKQYAAVKAVDSVSLKVGKGEIYGFLGLNGAGKTTTIRMLLGMIRPTAGAAYINGVKIDAGKCDIWKMVGCMVESPYSYPELTVMENLEMVSSLRGIKDKNAPVNVIEKMHLGEYADRKSKNLSLGNSQRLGLAKALIHNPQILILDEPANGLDPAGIVEIRELLTGLAEEGTTIFISSHILSEIAKIATRIGIIHKGRLIQEADFKSLDKLRLRRLEIGVNDGAKGIKILLKTNRNATLNNSGIITVLDDNAVAHPEEAAQALANAGCPPYLLKVEEEGLEEYFLRLIGTEDEKQ
jgi:ABC-2 type transport system ATP-binding protein